MMAQLLAHLWGDYLLQSDWMAQNKRQRNWPCAVHATLYAACFVPLLWNRIVPLRPILALIFIQVSHFYIDRYGLARYVVWAKNWVAPKTRWFWFRFPDREYWMPGTEHWGSIDDPSAHRRDFFAYKEVQRRCQPWAYCQQNGYSPDSPIWLTTWLLIIADNTLHLTCNYIALRWL